MSTRPSPPQHPSASGPQARAAEIHTSLDRLAPHSRCVAIGTFDGVHTGHRRVVQTARELARAADVACTVLTFDRHPLALLDPRHQPRLLTPLKTKVALLAALQPDEVVVLHFTPELAAQSPDDFCRDVLAAGLHASVVVVGENFTFGAGGAGTAQTLRDLGPAFGFRAAIVPLETAGHKPISSTRIRRLLRTGALEDVRDILGRPPSAHGRVVHGYQRGRQLGVPTANLDVEADTIFPGRGVYAARALVGDRWHRAAVNIGHNPTFHSRTEETATVHVEAFLLDFEGDIYGHEIQLDFLHKIRDEVRFEHVSQLAEQMQRDIQATRSLNDPAYAEVGLD